MYIDTYTSDYILPLLGYSKSYYIPDTVLTGSFIWDKDLEGYDGEGEKDIFILLKYNGRVGSYYNKISLMLENHKEFRFNYDLYEGRYVMEVIGLPREYWEDYDRFIKGEYSKFSLEAKKLIVKGISNNSIIPGVLNKAEETRIMLEDALESKIPESQELWSIPDREREAFSIHKYKL